jgi:hypothetical protein
MKKRKKRKENPIDRVAASAALVACVYRDLCGFTPDEISLVKTYLARMGVDYDHKELIPMMRADLAERLVECVDRGLLPDVVRALPEYRKKCRPGRLCLKHTIAYIQARNSCGRERPTYKEFAYALYGGAATDNQIRTTRWIADQNEFRVTRRKKNQK